MFVVSPTVWIAVIHGADDFGRSWAPPIAWWASANSGDPAWTQGVSFEDEYGVGDSESMMGEFDYSNWAFSE